MRAFRLKRDKIKSRSGLRRVSPKLNLAAIGVAKKLGFPTNLNQKYYLLAINQAPCIKMVTGSIGHWTRLPISHPMG